MGIIILVVLIIGYIVLAVLAAKTWQTLHVVLLVFLFLASVAFSMLAASVLKTHGKYRTVYNQEKAKLDQETERKERLLNGDPLSGEEGDPGLRRLEGQVKRGLLDRGRVWRNLALKEPQGNQLLLDAAAWGDEACKEVGGDEDVIEPEAEGAGSSAIKPLAIGEGAIVFAFRETPLAGLDPALKGLLLSDDTSLTGESAQAACKIPTAYLGEFRVVSVAADNSTLAIEPVRALAQAQIELIQSENFTWVLYERMPLDSHEVFAGLTAEQLKTLLPETEFGPDQARYAALLDQYVRDQQPAQDADAPERKQVRVRFTKRYEVDVDVPEAVPEPNQPFDPTGRAQSALLMQQEKTVFNEGDVATLDHATATRLQNDGFVEFEETLYDRELRDYEQAFRFYAAETKSVENEIKIAQADLDSLNESIARLKDQIAFRDDEKGKLTADSQGFEYERQEITKVREAMEKASESLRAELSKLYKANKQLAEKTDKLVHVSSGE